MGTKVVAGRCPGWDSSERKEKIMKEANSGDTVKVNYTGKLDDGTVVATSNDREPLRFVVGGGNLIAGFEEAVVGMKPGESKTAKIPAEKAFGPHREELVEVVDRNQLPSDLEPEIGQKLNMTDGSGKTSVVVVTEVTDSGVTLDANHLLAGKDLTFSIELVEIL
jgi:peptidylprolyl isomerase